MKQIKRHVRIESWDDERSIGNSLIVSLVHGWKFSSDLLNNEHVRGFDTVKDAMREVISAVPCVCNVCIGCLVSKPKRGRPATGSKTGAQRQADSRARRKALTCDSFSGQQVSWMLSPEAVKALTLLSINCGMSQKEVVEKLLCNAYELALKDSGA